MSHHHTMLIKLLLLKTYVKWKNHLKYVQQIQPPYQPRFLRLSEEI